VLLGFAADGALIRVLAQLRAACKPILERQPHFDPTNYYSAIDDSPMLVMVGRHASTGELRLKSPIAGNLSMQDMLQYVFLFIFLVFAYCLRPLPVICIVTVADYSNGKKYTNAGIRKSPVIGSHLISLAGHHAVFNDPSVACTEHRILYGHLQPGRNPQSVDPMLDLCHAVSAALRLLGFLKIYLYILCRCFILCISLADNVG
jgi:hypothetical protein